MSIAILANVLWKVNTLRQIVLRLSNQTSFYRRHWKKTRLNVQESVSLFALSFSKRRCRERERTHQQCNLREIENIQKVLWCVVIWVFFFFVVVFCSEWNTWMHFIRETLEKPISFMHIFNINFCRISFYFRLYFQWLRTRKKFLNSLWASTLIHCILKLIQL